MTEFVLYGPLRRWSPVQVALPPSATTREVREALIGALRDAHPDFSGDALIRTSAFGTDTHVLGAHELLAANGTYAVLPPVAGG